MTESYVQAGTRLAGDLPAGGTDAIHSVNLALERMAQMGARLAEAQSHMCACLERAQTQMCAALESQSLQIGRLATTLADCGREKPKGRRRGSGGSEGQTMSDHTRCEVVVDAKIKAESDVKLLKKEYLKGGVGYGEAKEELFNKILQRFSVNREKYFELLENKDKVEALLLTGAQKARKQAQKVLKRVRSRVGF